MKLAILAGVFSPTIAYAIGAVLADSRPAVVVPFAIVAIALFFLLSARLLSSLRRARLGLNTLTVLDFSIAMGQALAANVIAISASHTRPVSNPAPAGAPTFVYAAFRQSNRSGVVGLHLWKYEEGLGARRIGSTAWNDKATPGNSRGPGG